MTVETLVPILHPEYGRSYLSSVKSMRVARHYFPQMRYPNRKLQASPINKLTRLRPIQLLLTCFRSARISQRGDDEARLSFLPDSNCNPLGGAGDGAPTVPEFDVASLKAVTAAEIVPRRSAVDREPPIPEESAIPA